MGAVRHTGSWVDPGLSSEFSVGWMMGWRGAWTKLSNVYL